MKRVAVIGVGNTLIGDDGVGIHVIEELRKMQFPENILLLDCGCDLLNTLPYIGETELIIIIDAVKMGLKPGDIKKISLDDLEKIKIQFPSVHEINLVSSIRLAKEISEDLKKCAIILIGIEPANLSPGEGLSKEIESKIEEIKSLIIEILN